jgi:hypothetical protein
VKYFLIVFIIYVLVRTLKRLYLSSQPKGTEEKHPRQELIESYLHQAQGTVSTGELERRLAEARNELTSFEYSILLLRLSAVVSKTPPQDPP